MKKVLFVIILLLFTFLFTLFVYSPVFYQRDIVIVPDVENHNIDHAIEELKSNKLAVEIKYQDSSIEKDSIIETKPSKGNLVKEGSVVEISVSNGMLEQRMINVLNQYYDKAKEKLEAQGLKTSITVIEIEDETLPSRYVKKQYPKENDIIKEGDEIILFITKSVEYQVIPDMMYWEKSEAEKTMKKLELNVVYAYEYNALVGKGRVVRQSIAGGTEILLNKQNSITITLSLGPDLSYVPYIIDMKEIEAVVLLKKLGINYDIKYVTSNKEKGLVIESWKEVNNDTLEKVTIIVSGGKNEQGASD